MTKETHGFPYYLRIKVITNCNKSLLEPFIQAHNKSKHKEQTSLSFDPSINEYKAKLKSKPVNNQANLELIKLIATAFQIPQNKITILIGKRSNIKLVKINE